ncbi:MAG: hypothetical protein A3H98_07150 [Bacteroidetes bacterium RIFCSPLOWO2_02_FULL_36_8]|nr:MAG: hypothetical protein A3H98_07150 [Bacteroidetes bacterium RIFCSPLOWO2_02_FULL_36_8]OFY72258.1 MAG: hypothetical protein A3G23_01700 [Bacteroidetes bacterium RIFCSPLOWO2_12_FULL_37_12]
MNKTFLIIIFLVSHILSPVLSQTTPVKKKHLIYFTDKNNSPYSISNPQQFLSPRSIQRRNKQNILINQTDLPVTPNYPDSMRKLGAEVWYNSRWFNASLVETDSATLELIKKLPFVKSAKSLNKKIRNNGIQMTNTVQTGFKPVSMNVVQTAKTGLKPVSTYVDSTLYGSSYTQANMIGAVAMHEAGYHGEGMLIAVLDAGFYRADTLKAFRHLYQNNQIKGTYDFVAHNAGVYEDNTHGMMVLSLMAGYVPGMLIGTAYKAGYLLLRTEDVSSEQTIEEANWLMAAEFADSAGADVINSSLGYSTFDDSTQSYTYTNMDGNTALVTKAADMAAGKGILVVSSAGNYGNKPWKYISAPADGDSVLTVGAVSLSGDYASFSSVGPSYDRRVKPDITAPGAGVTYWASNDTINYGGGTSFSSPILCGMATGFWQAYPNLTAMEIIEILHQSGSQYTSPDSLMGYGIPDFVRAKQLVDIKIDTFTSNFQIRIYPNPFQNLLTIFAEGKPKEKINVRISDSSGRLVLEKQVILTGEKQLLRFEIGDFSKGIYMISIEGKKGKKILKTLKL